MYSVVAGDVASANVVGLVIATAINLPLRHDASNSLDIRERDVGGLTQAPLTSCGKEHAFGGGRNASDIGHEKDKAHVRDANGSARGAAEQVTVLTMIFANRRSHGGGLCSGPGWR